MFYRVCRCHLRRRARGSWRRAAAGRAAVVGRADTTRRWRTGESGRRGAQWYVPWLAARCATRQLSNWALDAGQLGCEVTRCAEPERKVSPSPFRRKSMDAAFPRRLRLVCHRTSPPVRRACSRYIAFYTCTEEYETANRKYFSCPGAMGQQPAICRHAFQHPGPCCSI